MAEWNHESVWGAIDAIAARHKLSPSGLAKKAGLDATAFNPSKRLGPDQRPRWPSTESIAKVLAATGESLATFVALAQPEERSRPRRTKGADLLAGSTRQVPLLGFAEAGTGGFFDDGGFPAGFGWEEITLPGLSDESSYALRVSGDSMLPLYRNGDVIIVSPTAPVRRGDRIVLKTTDGEVMAKILRRQNQAEIELASFNPAHASRTIAAHKVDWMARIMWASQ